MTQHVVSYSGGKDSTAMLLMMLERGMRVDRVIYVDMSKEFPAMYEHIERVQEMIRPVMIERVRVDFDYWFAEHPKSQGKTKGDKGFGWPYFGLRWCTGLKINAFYSALTGEPFKPFRKPAKWMTTDVVEYHGIAYDEAHRTKNNKRLREKRNVKYPLIEWGITEEAALAYCYSKGLDWGGLYRIFDRVSCWCCPLAKLSELQKLWKHYPELWAQLKEMDKKSKFPFKRSWRVIDLERRFEREEAIASKQQCIQWQRRE